MRGSAEDGFKVKAMQGIQEDGYESPEEEFHLTTSGEFCDGASRTRAKNQLDDFEELEELKLWDQEELDLKKSLGLTSVPFIPAQEVAALLREVPPSLRSRYRARLRAEAQRRRATRLRLETECIERIEPEAVEAESGGVCGRRWIWAPWSLMICAAIVLAWNRAPVAPAMGKVADFTFGRVWELERLRNRALETKMSNQSAINSIGCPDALKHAEDEAISLEVITRRDIIGYNQMLASIHDWTTTITAVPPIARCLDVEGGRYLQLVQDLKSSLLAAHARAARARARVTMERNARLFLDESVTLN